MILRAGRNAGEWLAWLVMAVALAAYLAIFLPLLPADGRNLGHDYALHLPNLLAGYFFYLRNGLLAVPWFNPGQCGGVPFFADLNVAYYSAPQALAFVVDPLAAVRITFVVFAALGCVGMYLLALSRFRASPAAAGVAAVIFLFNGFYAYRMAIGHLTFHPFMLTPWLALVVLPGPRARSIASDIVAAVIGGAILAYMFHAGMVHELAPIALIVVVILLAHGLIFGHAWRPWLRLAAAIAISLALSAARLAAALAFLRNFPRDEYPLPGFASFADAARLAFLSLFTDDPSEAGWAALTNKLYALDRHEWQYNVGIISAELLAVGAVALVMAWWRKRDRNARLVRALPIALVIAAILFLPLALNWYAPGWNAFLKDVPLLASSSSLIRWFALYIPLAALFAGLAVDRAAPARVALVALPLIALVVIASNAWTNKTYYTGQRYDAARIVAAWRAVAETHAVPPVTALSQRAAGVEPNVAIVDGHSDIDCYQPMFGYALEHLDRANIHAGPIDDVDGAGLLNLKNPACYIFPGANQCRPGDVFKATQKREAEAFAAYQAFPFEAPLAQRLADWLNLAALVAAAAALVILPLRRKGSARPLDANPAAG
ncbi:MAG TPA: hypothetical protein VHA70_04280 [Bauldia sp.]|nr:hypothetical protein [Bauldia sp.]